MGSLVDDKLFKKLLDFINVITNAYETFKGLTTLNLRGEDLGYILVFPFNKLQEAASFLELAERGGFEPPTRCREHTFQACALNRSAISPKFLALCARSKKFTKTSLQAGIVAWTGNALLSFLAKSWNPEKSINTTNF